MKIKTLLISTLLFTSSFTTAQAAGQPKGFISNENGDQCGYTQTVDDLKHLHSLPAKTTTMVFDDPNCMAETDLGYMVNIMMINNMIAKWYSHNDADFQTRENELFATSALQKQGRCMQSATYPNVGVAIDYVIEDGSITQVIHAKTVGGCKD